MNSFILVEPARVYAMISTVIAVTGGAITPSVIAAGSLRKEHSTALQRTGYNQDEIRQSNPKCETQESAKYSEFYNPEH
nr:hypothetical protein [Pseudomonas carnis]